jgi:hypothetical protein
MYCVCQTCGSVIFWRAQRGSTMPKVCKCGGTMTAATLGSDGKYHPVARKRGRSPAYSQTPGEFQTWVYTAGGYTRAKVTLRVGDQVHWKRNGTVGSYQGTIVKIGRVVRLRLESYGGREIPHREVNATTGFLRATRNGREITST